MPHNDALRTRALIYRKLRAFFDERGVLEVETPLLCAHTVTDPYIESIKADGGYLQTSPEYAMKRLLCAGSGPIFQICKAFRKEEAGRHHNPEFTMLEWYRPGFDHHDLMNELDELMQCVLSTLPSTKQSYRDCFLEHTSIDPLTCELPQLHTFIEKNTLVHDVSLLDADTALQIILSEYIEPKIGLQQPFFLYDFPASQAALSQIRDDTPPVAERFELYYKGLELANGFHELTDVDEQLQRFKHNQDTRRASGLTVPDIDDAFINALKTGLPPTSGVAVGLDRIIMLACGVNSINDVLIITKAQTLHT
ncbi:MAG: elongation factor P lysine(34) lysyltransferase [Coxiella sp. (in: Bacteria)]|nr:MAG: elongation factor P lysine(34) lysyltransferase [Coxiella sp. (in: g-proteobacteria)]